MGERDTWWRITGDARCGSTAPSPRFPWPSAHHTRSLFLSFPLVALQQLEVPPGPPAMWHHRWQFFPSLFCIPYLFLNDAPSAQTRSHLKKKTRENTPHTISESLSLLPPHTQPVSAVRRWCAPPFALPMRFHTVHIGAPHFLCYSCAVIYLTILLMDI